ncbi:hypothetical protein NZK32_09870 [Cyanobium sp. FGCU-52]|nr:hypothetical protein [Cyanobium sp. FGCU52]
MRSMRLRILLGSGLTLALALPDPAAAFDAERVMAFCQAGFLAAMTAASRTPPPGMADFTCRCFVDRVQAGTPIDVATDGCRERAAARFPLAGP